MFTPQELDEFRADAEAQMVDTFAAHAPDGFDVVDRMRVPKTIPKGSTPGKIQAPQSGRGGDTDTHRGAVGDAEPGLVFDARLHIPIAAPVPDVGWRYQCTAIGPRSDPALLNTWWEVVEVPVKTFATARRLLVKRVQQ